MNASFTFSVLMMLQGKQACSTFCILFLRLENTCLQQKKVVFVMLVSKAPKLPWGFSRAIGSKCPVCRSKFAALLEPMYIKSDVLHWTLYFSCLVLTLLTVKQPKQSRSIQSFLGGKQGNSSNLLLCRDLQHFKKNACFPLTWRSWLLWRKGKNYVSKLITEFTARIQLVRFLGNFVLQ